VDGIGPPTAVGREAVPDGLVVPGDGLGDEPPGPAVGVPAGVPDGVAVGVTDGVGTNGRQIGSR
jgi:hypothetical protein